MERWNESTWMREREEMSVKDGKILSSPFLYLFQGRRRFSVITQCNQSVLSAVMVMKSQKVVGKGRAAWNQSLNSDL